MRMAKIAVTPLFTC